MSSYTRITLLIPVPFRLCYPITDFLRGSHSPLNFKGITVSYGCDCLYQSVSSRVVIGVSVSMPMSQGGPRYPCISIPITVDYLTLQTVRILKQTVRVRPKLWANRRTGSRELSTPPTLICETSGPRLSTTVIGVIQGFTKGVPTHYLLVKGPS